MPFARLPALRRLVGAGRLRASQDDLALNLSFVLHERSDSDTVKRAARAIRQHARRRHTISGIVVDGPYMPQVDLWLTANLGAPAALEWALSQERYPSAPIHSIDQADAAPTDAEFFRAPAKLSLPGMNPSQVGVAALVLRPGGRDHLLLVRGPFTWPDDQQRTLRMLESMIQAHVAQWMPAVPLWPAAAEDLLESEIR